MKCNTGDKVRFLNDTGGGTVAGFKNKTTVIVRDSDGFDIPVPISEIVVVSENNERKIIDEYTAEVVETYKKSDIPEINRTKENTRENIKITTGINYKITAEDKDSDGIEFEIALGFLPVSNDNPENGDLQIYMINDSSYRMFYTIGKYSKSLVMPVKSGEMESDCKELVGILSKQEAAKAPVFQINFILFKNRDYMAQAVQQIDFELNPVKFLNSKIFTENDFFEQNAYIYILASSRKMLTDYIDSLSDSDIKKSQKNKKDDISSKKTQYAGKYEIEEVDLHVEALIDNSENLSNGEILKLQLDRFTIALNLGISARTGRMVFIHGKGNGKLKHEIHRLLDTQYAGKVRYQDASFKEYGYGATMVYIK
ncbi:MAG: DUF2027 domain-containing protein [Prevotellaceae bacterium]|jgi:hypothetical protein|nr:DUF2027 domain-containing protein [Prevotellaceae bacterium]